MRLNLTLDQPSTNRKKAIVNLKIYWAVYHEFHISADENEIAAAIHVSVKKLRNWRKSRDAVWENARAFWGLPVPAENEEEREQLRKEYCSLKCAEKMWKEMIRNGYDLFPSENQFLGGLRAEDPTADNQIGLEALIPPPRLKLWIHDLVTALWCIAGIVN